MLFLLKIYNSDINDNKIISFTLNKITSIT